MIENNKILLKYSIIFIEKNVLSTNLVFRQNNSYFFGEFEHTRAHGRLILPCVSRLFVN